MSPHTKEQKHQILEIAKLFGAIATAATAVVSLLFLFWPDLKPNPVSELGATLSDLTIERTVTLEDYLQMEAQAADVYPDKDLAQVGNIVHFKAELRGFKGKPCLVRCSLVDAQNARRLAEFTNISSLELIPEALIDRAVASTWVPTPTRPGKYFARIELIDSKGIRLAFADSEAFDGDLQDAFALQEERCIDFRLP